MKEPSIEQKAKAYDEALEKAKDFYKGYKQRDNQLYADDLETIFPELCESEDERVRKEIISFIQDHIDEINLQVSGDYDTRDKEDIALQEWCKKAIAWLEKQGSEPDWCHHKVDLSDCSEEYRKAYYDGWNNCNMQHSQCKSESNVVVKCLINGMKFYYEDNKEATWGTEKFSMKVKDILSWLEKQGEQKPVDKVEPKFKVGDWIVFNGLTLYVKEVVRGFYRTISKGGITNSYDWDIDNIARLWTIQDAKDGDILASDNSIFIFQEEYIAEKPIAYCGLMNGCFIVEGEDACWTNEKCYPATKEQRNTLMKAMKEAGYEWDVDKKELKKIEKKSQRMVSAEAKEALYDKPAWSEEDIRNIQDIDSILFYDKDLPEETCMRLRNWLQSLKPNKDMVEALRTEYEKGKADGIAEMKIHIDIMDKDNIDDFAYQCAYDLSKDWLYEHASWDDVQIACKLGAKWYENHHKIQWSEEDEVKINRIVACLENLNVADNDILLKDVDWLKSLRPQKQWKPTEEQMQALKDACGEHWEPDGLDSLYTLYEQLKMLTK